MTSRRSYTYNQQQHAPHNGMTYHHQDVQNRLRYNPNTSFIPNATNQDNSFSSASSTQRRFKQFLLKIFCCKSYHSDASSLPRGEHGCSPQTLEFWIVPFVFSTSILVLSITTILFSYLLPSFKHSYQHITMLSVSSITIYLLLLAFFTALTILCVLIILSVKRVSHGKFHSLKTEKRRTELFLTLLFIFSALVMVGSLYIGYGMILGFPSPSANGAEEGFNLEKTKEVVKLFVKDQITDTVMAMVNSFQHLIKQVNLPKVPLDTEKLLGDVLKENAFYQATALIRIGKFLVFFFGITLNLLLLGTIYFAYQYRLVLLQMMAMDYNGVGYGDENGYVERSVPMPGSSDEDLAMLQKSSVHQYLSESQSPATESTRIISPEHASHNRIGMINEAAERIMKHIPRTNHQPPSQSIPRPTIVKTMQREPTSTTNHGIIEVPYINKSVENLTYQRSRPGSRAPSRPMSRTGLNKI